MRGLTAPFAATGEQVINMVAGSGRLAIFLGRLAREIPPGLRYVHLFFEQCVQIGLASLPLVLITSLFVGGVAALQSAYQFKGYVPLIYVGTVISKSVFIELGPVLTALVVGGRVGAALAAEIGTMRVTEQIDALETLAIRPMRYLVVPRFIAAIFMLPMLTVFANTIAVLGGMVVAVNRVGISSVTFQRGMKLLFDVNDIYGGLIKAFVFGAIIALSGCYYGFQTRGGAEGVGESTKKAVVASCVGILVLDYFLAEVIFQLLFGAR
ncbi:MAG: ABC transporter permease [Candidatus Eisenbacteria bacterium]|uniref:ABC transporter permease n=1 Tax=Eiseniibacteriota bacterium TaxID=2212470 RepID=A0A7Y2EEJ7_UNCEI|nr:ABC transporter permease [Candidatus Eisenbacteria bacterium]